MFKEDYIIRMIEQMGEFLRKVLKLEEDNKFEEAHDEISKAMKKLGVSPLLVRTMPPDGLMSFVTRPGGDNEDRCILLARLLSADAHIYKTEEKNSTAHELYKTALEFLTDVSEKVEGEKLERVQKDIEEIRYLMTENIREDKFTPGL